MKVNNTSNTQKIDNKVNDMNEDFKNQKNTPKESRIGIGMSDEQKDLAEKIKNDILNLYKEGYSIRMISNHYNDLYAERDSRRNIAFDVISRETVRKIINNQSVSLKSIVRLINI